MRLLSGSSMDRASCERLRFEPAVEERQVASARSFFSHGARPPGVGRRWYADASCFNIVVEFDVSEIAACGFSHMEVHLHRDSCQCASSFLGHAGHSHRRGPSEGDVQASRYINASMKYPRHSIGDSCWTACHWCQLHSASLLSSRSW